MTAAACLWLTTKISSMPIIKVFPLIEFQAIPRESIRTSSRVLTSWLSRQIAMCILKALFFDPWELHVHSKNCEKLLKSTKFDTNIKFEFQYNSKLFKCRSTCTVYICVQVYLTHCVYIITLRKSMRCTSSYKINF